MFLREGSLPGPNGFGAEHLNAAIKLSMLDRQGLLRRHRCSWSTSWRTMGGSDTVTPFLCGERLHAGNKKDRGKRDNTVVRKLSAKCGV